MRSEDAPPYILVGIGYPSDSPYAGMLLRAREYTYPPYPKFDVNAGYRTSEMWRALNLYHFLRALKPVSQPPPFGSIGPHQPVEARAHPRACILSLLVAPAGPECQSAWRTCPVVLAPIHAGNLGLRSRV
jgi:hypothetical protein